MMLIINKPHIVNRKIRVEEISPLKKMKGLHVKIIIHNIVKDSLKVP